MPDVQEVFRMATQKVRRIPGPWSDTSSEQRKAARNRRVGAFAMVVVLVAARGRGLVLTPAPVAERAVANAIDPDRPRGRTLDLRTGRLTELPSSIATSGAYYAVSPDHTAVAYNTCCNNPSDPLRVANVDGTQVRQISQTGIGRVRRAVVRGRLDARLPAAERLDAALGNLFVQDVATGERTQLTDFDQTQQFGLWFMFPELRAGRSVGPLPAADEATPATRSGTSGPCRSTAVSRRSSGTTRVGWLLAGRHVSSPTSHRSTGTTSPAAGSGSSSARRGHASGPRSRREPRVGAVVSGRDADLVLGRRLGLRRGRRDRSDHEGRLGRHRRVVRRPHADDRESRH